VDRLQSRPVRLFGTTARKTGWLAQNGASYVRPAGNAEPQSQRHERPSGFVRPPQSIRNARPFPPSSDAGEERGRTNVMAAPAVQATGFREHPAPTTTIFFRGSTFALTENERESQLESDLSILFTAPTYRSRQIPIPPPSPLQLRYRGDEANIRKWSAIMRARLITTRNLFCRFSSMPDSISGILWPLNFYCVCPDANPVS